MGVEASLDWWWITQLNRLDSKLPAGGNAGAATHLGQEVFRSQLWVSSAAVGTSGSNQAQQYLAAGYRSVVDLDL